MLFKDYKVTLQAKIYRYICVVRDLSYNESHLIKICIMRGLGVVLWALFLCYLFCPPMFWILLVMLAIVACIYIYKIIVGTIDNEKERRRLGKKWYEP